jgi:hypothetical protein
LLAQEAAVNGLTLMAGAAMVGALATSKWQAVRSAVARSLLSASAPGDHDAWDDFVMKTRRSIDAARRSGNSAAEQQLAYDWAQRLQMVLIAEPGLDAELSQVVYEVLLPVLPEEERLRVIRIAITAPRDQVISHNFLRSSDKIVR